MFHDDILRPDQPQPRPVEPDPCTRLTARRTLYLGYLRRRIGDPDAAEDVLQDFSLKVICAARHAGVVRNTDAWLARVLRNALYDHYRRSDARRRATAAHAGYAAALSGSEEAAPGSADADQADERAVDIGTALARIRPDQAELIRALYLQGRSRESLAAALNVRPGTLNVRVLRARRALREELVGLRSGMNAAGPAPAAAIATAAEAGP